MTPPKFFLSYCRINLEEVKAIGKILMIHGLQTWQDINSLGLGHTEDQICAAIQNDCDGLVFYSTAESLKSPIVLKVELKEAEDKFLKTKKFHLIPVFKSSIEDSNQALQGHMKTKISDFNGAVLKDDNLTEVAQRIASLALNHLDYAEEVVPIAIASYQKTSAPVALDLDFTPFFASGWPSPDDWNSKFVPAFIALKNSLLSKQKRNLRIFPHAHLSFGFAFGYVFRDRTGFTLETEQINKPTREIWSTATKEESSPVAVSCTPVGNMDSKNIVVNLNIISNDKTSMNDYFQKANLKYRAIIEATPPSYPFLISNGQAIALARQLAEKIKEAHGKFGTNTVHLFSAVPFGLALLIGHHLNACGKIQCYEFDKAKREYLLSVVLDNF